MENFFFTKMFKFDVFWVFLSGVACVLGSVSMHNPFYCFDTDPIRPQNTMFAPVTNYDNARGRGLINPSVSTCPPRKLFLLSRHGTTLPIASEINRMLDIHESLKSRVIQNYDAGRTQLCWEDIQNIREWTISPDVRPERSFELTQQGWNEFRGLGERLSEAFPNVLPRTYSPTQFLFRGYGNTSVNGLQGFAEGIFGEWENVEFAAGSEPDILLMPTSHCPLYDEARTNSIEMDAFESGPEFDEMLVQVNRKLGFIGSNQLSAFDIRTVWDFCRFEQGWNSTTPSPWCAAFSIANHAVLEYWLDLQYYYWAGYGGDIPLFSNINCQVLQDMLTFIESSDPDDHLARIYGTQALALPLFLVSLGAFNGDVLLTRHNFAQQTFRQWRTSVMDNTGSNFVLVQFNCDDGDNELLVLFNERPLSIPGCNAVTGLCKQSFLVERYRRFLDANCSDIFCSRAVI